ncbi:hypothetical protein L208DRAFT_708812 [Tricholoma matsutake]|nr:hypothetical protein L208DRAFT_708812 [Tricholoma matsutake 945]
MFHFSRRSSLASIPGTNHSRIRNDTLASIFANGFPYSTKLSGHRSCVNALAFSSRDGRFLASGGDDLAIHLWDFHQDDVKTSASSFRGPKGNIFCLAFSATNRYLGGTDENILKYDMNHFGSHMNTISKDLPDQTFREHLVRPIRPKQQST